MNWTRVEPIAGGNADVWRCGGENCGALVREPGRDQHDWNFHECTPENPHEDGWTPVYDDRLAQVGGNPSGFTCAACDRPATPDEAEAEAERLYDASLPDMTGYQEQ